PARLERRGRDGPATVGRGDRRLRLGEVTVPARERGGLLGGDLGGGEVVLARGRAVVPRARRAHDLRALGQGVLRLARRGVEREAEAGRVAGLGAQRDALIGGGGVRVARAGGAVADGRHFSAPGEAGRARRRG